MRISHALLLTPLFVLAPLAQAQVGGLYRSALLPGMSEGGTASLLVLQGRRYLGSDESRTLVAPGLDYKWSNGFFAGTGNGIGFDFSERSDLHYGLRITLDNGRKEKRSPALRGLGDVELRPEAGGFLTYNPAPGWTLGAALRYGAGNERDGLVMDVGTGFSVPVARQLRLGVQLTASWANANYLGDYFGVNAQQAVASGYQPYSLKAGWRDARVGLSANYILSPTWGVSLLVSRNQLLGDVKDSPIVRESASTSAGVALSYRF